MIIIPRKFKEWLPYIAIILLLVFFGVFAYQSHRADHYYDKYLVAEGKFQVENEAYIELKKETDTEKAILAKERDEEARARQQRDREINKIKAEGRKKDRALVEAKAKIKELTPDELTTELNSRVPSQFALLAAGDFSLTRYGGESTLSIFLGGERCVEALSERNSEIKEYKIKEISFNKDRKSFKLDLKKTEKLVFDCDKARQSAITSKENLEKAFRAMKVKQFFKGAGGVGLIVVVLKVTGVI